MSTIDPLNNQSSLADQATADKPAIVTPASLDFHYTVGGALKTDDPTYVVRPADEKILQYLQDGYFCYVLSCRQMGKSSLRSRVIKYFKNQHYLCLFADLSIHKNDDIYRWYYALIYELFAQSKLAGKVNLDQWLDGHSRLPASMLFYLFVREILLAHTSQPILICLDEIDSLLSLPFKGDDLFVTMRAFYNNRPDYPEFERLNLAIFGVATSSDLVQDKTRTPFNIGQAIDLQWFDLNCDLTPLTTGLQRYAADPMAVMQAILHWTGGQPFLTQKVCDLICLSNNFLAAGQETAQVAQLVQQQIIEHWERNDLPQHLRTIRDRVRRSPAPVSLLAIYGRLLQNEAVKINGSEEQVALRLTGLVVEKGSDLAIANPIYRAVFDLDWVQQTIFEFRPYNDLLQRWLAADGKDENYLLTGAALIAAQQWAMQYGNEKDTAFINACRELEKQRLIAAVQAKLTVPPATPLATPPATAAPLSALITPAPLTAPTTAQPAVDKQDQPNQDKPDNDDGRLRNLVGILLLFGLLLNAVTGNASTPEANNVTNKVNADKKPRAAKSVRAAKSNNSALTKSKLAKPTPAKSASARKTSSTVIWPVPPIIVDHSLQTFSSWGMTMLEVIYSPDGRQVIAGRVDGTATIWDATTGQRLLLLRACEREQLIMNVSSVAYSPDSHKVLTASADGVAKIWDAAQGQLRVLLSGPPASAIMAKFSPDGCKVVTANNDGTTRIWDAATGQLFQSLDGHQNAVVYAEFSPDGYKVVTASIDHTAKIWDVATGQLLQSLNAHRDDVISAKFSPDGRQVLTTSHDHTAKIWDTATGQLLFSLEDPLTKTRSAEFSPDGHKVVTANNQVAKIWNATTGQLLLRLEGHQSDLSTAKFSPDGRSVLTISSDRIAKVWDATTAQLLHSLEGHYYGIDAAAFSPDSRRAITASWDGTVKVWNITPMPDIPITPILAIPSDQTP